MAFKTSNQKKDESEKILNSTVESAISDAKTPPENKPYDPTEYKLKKAREVAQWDKKAIEEREQKKEEQEK